MKPAIRKLEDFKILGQLCEYLMSKTMADALVCEIFMDNNDVYLFKIKVPKVKELFFRGVIIPEVGKFFPHLELTYPARASVIASYDPDNSLGVLSIFVKQVLVAELFCSGSLHNLYLSLGKTLGDSVIKYFDYAKVQALIKVWENKE